MAVTPILSTMILLFAAIITIAPLQQAYSYQPLEQEPSDTAKPAPIPTTTSNSSIVPVGCAMDTIESLQSFLSCLGAK